MKKGLVYRSTGSWYTVESEGIFYACRIKGKLRLNGIKSTNPIAVGDWVNFEVDSNAAVPEGTINKIEERRNYIVRKSVNLSKQTHIIASNIDQVFLIVTLNNPTTFPAFIDRFLVTAQAYQIPAILLSKASCPVSVSARRVTATLEPIDLPPINNGNGSPVDSSDV